MKKWISLLLVILFASLSVAESESMDLSGMSVEELLSLKSRIISELESREPAESTVIDYPSSGPVVLVNEGGVKIYLTGKYRTVWGNEHLLIGFAFENESGKPLSVWARDADLNGWHASGGIISSTIESGQKNADELTVSLTDALLTDYPEMEELSFTIEIDGDNYEKLKTYGPFKLRFHFGE